MVAKVFRVFFFFFCMLLGGYLLARVKGVHPEVSDILVL